MIPTNVSEISSLSWGQVISNRPQLWARIGIGIQFAALIRCLGEFFRLKYFVVDKSSMVHVEPFIIGGLMTAILAFVAILFYFAEKYPLTALTSAIIVVILFVLRFALL